MADEKFAEYFKNGRDGIFKQLTLEQYLAGYNPAIYQTTVEENLFEKDKDGKLIATKDSFLWELLEDYIDDTSCDDYYREKKKKKWAEKILGKEFEEVKSQLQKGYGRNRIGQRENLWDLMLDKSEEGLQGWLTDIVQDEFIPWLKEENWYLKHHRCYVYTKDKTGNSVKVPLVSPGNELDAALEEDLNIKKALYEVAQYAEEGDYILNKLANYLIRVKKKVNNQCLHCSERADCPTASYYKYLNMGDNLPTVKSFIAKLEEQKQR